MGLFVAKFSKSLKASACSLIVLFVKAKDFDQAASAAAANQPAIAFRDEFYFNEGLVLVSDAQDSIAAMSSDVALNHRAHKATG
jgi:hypothetical protein